jgi:nucleoside-diphosphate-sugar epimerase
LLPGSHAAIEAALKGLSARSEKGFYIQTSGAFIIGEDTGGKAGSGKIWSDIADIDALVAMPSTRYHQRTEQIVRDASANVNVAIVSPTVVYGLSSSLENQIPITIRDIVDTVSELSAGFTIAQGENILGYIHADDLADIYVRLVADALKGLEGHDPRLWGAHAYYFAVGEDMSFAAYMKALVEVLQTRVSLSTNAIKEIGEANDVAEQEVVARTAASHGCGVNVRCRSDRAETLLGWKAKGLGLIDTLPGVVDILLSRSAH